MNVGLELSPALSGDDVALVWANSSEGKVWAECSGTLCSVPVGWVPSVDTAVKTRGP